MKHINGNSITTVFYIRANQEESLYLQKVTAEKHAEQNSLPINIIVDAKTTGMKPLNERSGMQTILQLVKGKAIETIIVDTLHRVSRDAEQLKYFIDFLREKNIKLVVLDGDL